MEKRFKSGLVLGKFMPLHNGHLHLINSAAEQCEKVFVMICSLKSEPIHGKMRWSWLQMIFQGHNNIEIIHCEDENPQHPEEASSTDSFYNDFWVPSVYERIDELDVVFTSESYGDEFAKYLGVEHVLVDIDRKTFPISGTNIRKNPPENWVFIPEVVMPYFTKRIVIVGPESTGKSTLVEKLAHEYGVSYLPEYGRTYTETITPSKELVIEDFYQIAETHNDMLLEKHINNRRPWLFVDTDAITTKLFGQMYLDGYEDNRVDEIIKHQWFDLTLLMDIDVEWVNDGTRDFPNDRKKHFDMIKNELDKHGRKYV